MTSTFFGIETMRRAILSQRTVMDTIGHNIANASTPGYTRQEVILTPTSAFSFPGMESVFGSGQVGTGVMTEEIRRIRDEFVDSQVRSGLTDAYQFQVEKNVLRQIENVFLEPSTTEGFNGAYSTFFNAWQELSKRPDNISARQEVVSYGQNLVDVVNNVDQTLRDIRVDLNGQLNKDIDIINDIVKQISNLTPEIAKVFTHGNSPNDLLDKRDVLLDELAQYVNYEVADSEFVGGLTISIGGRVLLQNDHVFELSNVMSWDHPSQNTKTPYMNDASQEDFYMLSQFSRGELQGIINSRDVILPEVQQQFTTLVGSFVDAINNAHSMGVGVVQEDYAAVGSGTTADITHNANYAVIGALETGLFSVGDTIRITDTTDPSSSIIKKITNVVVENGEGRLYFDNTGPLLKSVQTGANTFSTQEFSIASGAAITRVTVDKNNFFVTPELLDSNMVGDTDPDYFTQMSSALVLPENVTMNTTVAELETMLGVEITDSVTGKRIMLDNIGFTQHILETDTIQQVIQKVTDLDLASNDGNKLSIEFDEINRHIMLSGETRTALDEIGGSNGSEINLFRILGFEGTSVKGLAMPDGATLSSTISDLGISQGWFQIDNAKIQITDTDVTTGMTLRTLLSNINKTLEAGNATSKNTSVFFDDASRSLRVVSDHLFSVETPVPAGFPSTPPNVASNFLTITGLQNSSDKPVYSTEQTLASVTTSDIAARLKINRELVGSDDALNKVATSSAYSGLPGDGTIATDIAAIKNQFILGDSTSGSIATPTLTIDQFYNNLISDVGVRSQQAILNNDSADKFLEYYQNKQEEVSGVSLDEEMTKLIEAQHSFQAASRMINTIDEMLDRIINGMGLVGR